MRRLALIAAVAAVCATPAGARAAWSQPQQVSGQLACPLESPELTFPGGDTGYLLWEAFEACSFDASRGIAAAVAEAEERYGPEAITSVPTVRAAVYRQARFVDVEREFRGVGLFATFGRIGSRGKRREVLERGRVGHHALAVTVHGTGVAAWERRGRIDAAALATSENGGELHRFEKPFAIAPRGARRPAVAASGRDLVVAWERAGRVELRVRRSGRPRFGPVVDAGPSAPKPSIAAGIHAGRVSLAWQSYTKRVVNGGSVPDQVSIRGAAYSGSGSSARDLLLDRYTWTREGGKPPRIELGRSGFGVAAWTTHDPATDRFRIRAAEILKSGIQEPRTVATAEVEPLHLDDVAVFDTGQVADLAWTEGESHIAPNVYVSHRPGLFGAWQPKERLNPPGEPGFDAAIAYPFFGRLHAAWYYGEPYPPSEPRRLHVVAAHRSG